MSIDSPKDTPSSAGGRTSSFLGQVVDSWTGQQPSESLISVLAQGHHSPLDDDRADMVLVRGIQSNSAELALPTGDARRLGEALIIASDLLDGLSIPEELVARRTQS